MIKTYLHIPSELNEDILTLTQITNVSKAQVLRDALKKGLTQLKEEHPTDSDSAKSLFEIAALGERYKHKFKGPTNSSTRIDELLWDKDWSNE